MNYPTHYKIRCIALFLVTAFVSSLFAHRVAAASAPEVLDPLNYVNIYRLPDGTIKRVRASNGYLISQSSTDNGMTWGSATQEFATPGSTNPVPLVDDVGEVHYFRFLLDNQTNGDPIRPNVNYFLDIWHTRSQDNQTTWPALEKIHHGYTGSMMAAIQTEAGRIVLPFGNWIPNGKTSDPFGRNYTTAVYSDDRGETWQRSASQLYSPVPANYNGNGEGAVEPTLVQLNDGRLWMLIRTQAGTLYESYSSDEGATWSEAGPSDFRSSTGPPNMLRMDDGRLVLLWNNATMPAQHEDKVWYAGRDALHAAVSSDDGRTWSGFREVYLDPYRNESPLTGDSGTAYPFLTQTDDGRVLAITGQARARAMLRIDPDWLEETDAASDFAGDDPLANWSVFKSIGPVESTKRDRMLGAHVVADPDGQANNPVLQLGRPDTNDPDGAAWNFPLAKKGVTSVRLKLQEGFAGGSIGLADNFFQPTDDQGEAQAIFRLDIGADGSLTGGGTLDTGQWYDLNLRWDLASHTAEVVIDGTVVGSLDQRHQALPGPSYLRLRSTSQSVDTAGYLVESVSQIGLATGPIRESIRMSVIESQAALSGGNGWTAIRFDDYVPNLNTTASGNGPIATITGDFTGFLSPTTSAEPLGFVVNHSSGNVVFSDGTSAQRTSDILGTKSGSSLVLTFVDPDDPSFKAVVSGVAFRFGSVVADNVKVTLLDVDGNVMPDYLFESLAESLLGSSVGFLALEDLERRSAIHQIVFESASEDTWLLGSFARDPGFADFAVLGFEVVSSVPEPGSLAVLVVVGLLLGVDQSRRGTTVRCDSSILVSGIVPIH